MDEIIKAKSKKQEDKERYKNSTDFLVVRRAVMQNFIAHNAPIKEEDLTPHDVYMIIYGLGRHFSGRNIAGLTEVPTFEDLL